MLGRIVLLIIIFFTSCQERIIHDLNELDANKIISKLYQAEIKSKKEKQADGLWSISVPQSHVVPAIQLIEDYRFFKKPEVSEQQSKLLTSEQEEKLIYENSLASQLETTLQSLTGVLEAHVHFNINTESSIWKKTNTPHKDSTAGVLLIVNQEFVFTNEEVKQLVGGASGIELSKINIVISYPALLDVKNSKLESSKSVEIATAEVLPKEFQKIMVLQIVTLIRSEWFQYFWLGTLFLFLPYLIWKQHQARTIKKFKTQHALTT